MGEKLLNHVKCLVENFNKEGLVDNEKLRLMDTLRLLFKFLCTCGYRVVPRSVISEACVEFTEAEIFDKWEKLLHTLESDDWTYDQLVSIVLPKENITYNCYGCGKEVNPRSVGLIDDMSSGSGYDGKSKFYFTPVSRLGFFICEASVSSSCLVNLFKNEYVVSGLSLDDKNTFSRVYSCDNCFKSTADVHRCSKCLTKLYCGTKCRDEDWPIHKYVCVKVKRKIKEGKGGRRESIMRAYP